MTTEKKRDKNDPATVGDLANTQIGMTLTMVTATLLDLTAALSKLGLVTESAKPIAKMGDDLGEFIALLVQAQVDADALNAKLADLFGRMGPKPKLVG